MNLPALLDRVSYRYPAQLIDVIEAHEPGSRLVAFKNVSISEDYFQGHFPRTPLMPAVLMVEALTQAAAILMLDRAELPHARVWLRGVNNAKFRRQVVPGDRLRLEVHLGRCRARLGRVQATAYLGEHVVAEAELVLEKAVQRVEAEAKKTAQLRSGVSSVELNKLGKVFEALGLVEE